VFFFFFQAEDGIRDLIVTGVQTCALPIYLDKTTSPGRPPDPQVRAGDPTQPHRASRRTLLSWMVGIAAGAFAVSFAVPAAALKALMLEKPVIAVGDVLTYADTASGGQPGQPFKAADLAVGGSAQLFP